MQAQIQAIKTKVQECIKAAEAKFGITMPNVDIRFDLTGRAAGMAGFHYGKFYLRFNTKHMALGGQTWDHLLNDTVPHEVAHTVCQAFPKFGRNHDAGWKRVCIALGGNGQRCYSEADAPEAVAAQRPYVYITTTGHECRVTKVIHTKIQRGTTYTMKGGKGKLTRECQYNYMTAPAVKAAAKPVVVNTDTIKLGTKMVEVPIKKPAPAPATASKAEQIRAMIKRGNTQEQVVEWAVATLGMTRALAKTYVKNNWNKV
jgi:predicted SprT family Zn-dependent metalloprotease